jgi:hypothetical protein
MVRCTVLAGVAMAALASPMSVGVVRAGDAGQFESDFQRCIDGVPKGSRLKHSMSGFWYYAPDTLEEALAHRDGIAECRRIAGEGDVLARSRASDAAVRKAAGY